MKFLFDFFPIILFFIAFKVADIYVATGVAIAATFGQAHADATHVKLIEGESAAELVPLVNLVGRVRVASVSALARW